MNTRMKLVVILNISDDNDGIPSTHKLPLFSGEGHTQINRHEVIINSHHMESKEMTFKSR